MPETEIFVHEQLTQRLKYEQGLAQCSHALLRTGLDLKTAINKALKALLDASGVSRVYIFENKEDDQLGTCMCQTFEACAEGVSAEIDNPVLQRLPYNTEVCRWRDAFIGGEHICGLVETFPALERGVLEPQGILSLLAIPIYVSEKWFGFIGFDDTVCRRQWGDGDIRLLRTASEMIGSYYERHQAMEELKYQQAQLLSIFDSIDEPIYVSDMESYEILFANRFICKTLKENLIGNICYKVLQGRDEPCDFCTNHIIQKSADTSYKWEHHNPKTNKKYLCYDRMVRWPDGRAVRFELAIDISERSKLKEDQDRAARLESIGLLAGGIAHDFNNILTAILGNITLAIEQVEEHPNSARELLSGAESATFNARDLTQQLLTFSKGGHPVVRTTDLNALVSDAVTFALRGSNLLHSFEMDNDLWQGKVDSGQIAQVINNMTINAIQAMPDGGEIKIAAKNMVVEERSGLALKPGKYVRIDFSDNGRGIPAMHLSRIFDPYFTTKQEGHGLGLTASYSIVKRHNGLITVESSEYGATFHIYLPAVEGKPSVERVRQSEPPARKARVLVMDDEDMIRSMISMYLTTMGHEVDAVRDGEQALELFKNSHSTGNLYDAVILDLTVPGGMGGKQTFELMREIDPDVNAIISSGYSSDPVIANYRNHGFKAFITKPFKLDGLSSVLQNALNGNE